MFNNKHTVLEDGIRYEKRNGLSTKTEEAPGQERIGPGSTLSLSAPTAEMSTTGEDRRGSRPEGVRRAGAASRYTRSAASRFASRWTTLIILIMTLIGTARAGTCPCAAEPVVALFSPAKRRFSGSRSRAAPRVHRVERVFWSVAGLHAITATNRTGRTNPSAGPKRVTALHSVITNNTNFPRFALTLALLSNAGTLLEKLVSRTGMVGIGNYKYYKLHLRCTQAAQPTRFKLIPLDGNPDLYISKTVRNPTKSMYSWKSEETGLKEDVIEIERPEAGTYYIAVYGEATATFKLTAFTKMWTGKHPCTGFRIEDNDTEEENTDGSFLLENKMTVTGGVNFESNLNVLQDVTLGDSQTDTVAIKGQIELGTASPGEYVINKADTLNVTGGTLVLRGANTMGASAGNVTLMAGLGTQGRGGSMNLFAGAANYADAGDLTIGTGRALEGRAGNLTIFVSRGDVGVGGNVTVKAGLTTARDMPGGSVNIAAGIGAHTTGGRGGVVQIDGGLAQGNTSCNLTEYVCSGVAVNVAVYEAVLHGCISDFSTLTSVANVTYLCGTLPVSSEQYFAVLGGYDDSCDRQCRLSWRQRRCELEDRCWRQHHWQQRQHVACHWRLHNRWCNRKRVDHHW